MRVAVEDEVLLWRDRVSLVPAVRVEVDRDDFPPDPLLDFPLPGRAVFATLSWDSAPPTPIPP